MYGKTCCLAYSLKVFAVPVGSILVIAAPSKMMNSAAGLAAAAFSCGGARSSKHPTRSNFVMFVPCLIMPICESAGGHAWFSCMNNSSRLPSRISDAVNNPENREESFFREDTCSFVLDFSPTGGRLKRGRLFLLIGSVMGFVWLISLSWT